MEIKDKAVVITGASMGIGESLARAFVHAGARVVMASRDLTRVEAARQRVGSAEQTLARACDVRKRADLDALLQATLAAFGRVDIWINNAGHGLSDSVANMNMQDCRAMFDTNLFGAIDGMQVAIAQMKKQGRGIIVNISSIAGHIPLPYLAAYSASKFALNAIGKAARVELKGSGVHVLTVCPGYIATDFATNAVKGTDRQRLSRASAGIPPDRVARAVLRACVREKREILVPWKDRLTVSLYQHFPALVEWSMAGMLRPADEVIAKAAALKSKS